MYGYMLCKARQFFWLICHNEQFLFCQDVLSQTLRVNCNCTFASSTLLMLVSVHIVCLSLVLERRVHNPGFEDCINEYRIYTNANVESLSFFHISVITTSNNIGNLYSVSVWGWCKIHFVSKLHVLDIHCEFHYIGNMGERQCLFDLDNYL